MTVARSNENEGKKKGKNNSPKEHPTNKSSASSSFVSESEVEIYPSRHLDFVHDAAFDHYGRRLATCSGDRSVRIWDLDDDGKWTSRTGSEWRAHRSAVNRVSWAHPAFGQILATCGADGIVSIWEEREGVGSTAGAAGSAAASSGTGFSLSSTAATGAAGSSAGGAAGNTSGGGGGGSTRWIFKTNLTEAQKSVTCIEFAPRHHGLRLAAGSADGIVRVYEAMDLSDVSAQWLLNSFSVETPATPKADAPAPAAPAPAAAASMSAVGAPSFMGVTALSWCTARFEPPTLVVGASLGTVYIYRYSDASRSWHHAFSLPNHQLQHPQQQPQGRPILDISWAPNVGRPYHYIATAEQGGSLRIHRFLRSLPPEPPVQTTAHVIPSDDDDNEKKSSSSPPFLSLESTHDLEKPSLRLENKNYEVWRCAWNVTGTVLASSDNVGYVKLWKCDFQNNWKCVSQIYGDTSASSSSMPSTAAAAAAAAAMAK